MTFDICNDLVLISIGTSDDANHSGFDILKPDGSIIRSLRYDQKEQGVVGQIIRSKWLNQKEIIIVYQLSINSQYDVIQRINWEITKVENLPPVEHRVRTSLSRGTGVC